jgi:hypothetical protein
MVVVEPDIKAVASEIFHEAASRRLVGTGVVEEDVPSRTKAFSLWSLVLVYAIADVTRTDRTSPIENPMVSQQVQQLAADTYFPDVKRRT